MKELDLFYKILLSDKPSELIKENEEYFFELIPDLKKCKGFNQNSKWHIYDVYEHTLHVVDGVDNNIIMRIAALFHDLGKPYVYKKDENGNGHFYNHWVKSNEIFLKFAKDNNFPDDMTRVISNLILYHDLSLEMKDIKLKALIKEIGKENIKYLFNLKRADLKAQSSEFHYMLDRYDKEEEKLNNLV